MYVSLPGIDSSSPTIDSHPNFKVGPNILRKLPPIPRIPSGHYLGGIIIPLSPSRAHDSSPVGRQLVSIHPQRTTARPFPLEICLCD